MKKIKLTKEAENIFNVSGCLREMGNKVKPKTRLTDSEIATLNIAAGQVMSVFKNRS